MLTIIVGPRKQCIEMVDGNRMMVYPLLVKEDNKFLYLNRKTELSEVQDVELVIVRIYLPFVFWKVKLTPELKKAIIDFLLHHHAKQHVGFDCYAFAISVKNLTPRKGPVLWSRFWKVVSSPWLRKVGDIIFLQNRGKKHFHAAVYIGLGLYLSVYGGGGDLEVATLRDMKKDYEVPEALDVVPLT